MSELNDAHFYDDFGYWKSEYEKIRQAGQADPNRAIRDALASPALVTEAQAGSQWFLARNTDGKVIRRRELPDGTFEEGEI